MCFLVEIVENLVCDVGICQVAQYRTLVYKCTHFILTESDINVIEKLDDADGKVIYQTSRLGTMTNTCPHICTQYITYCRIIQVVPSVSGLADMHWTKLQF